MNQRYFMVVVCAATQWPAKSHEEAQKFLGEKGHSEADTVYELYLTHVVPHSLKEKKEGEAVVGTTQIFAHYCEICAEPKIIPEEDERHV